MTAFSAKYGLINDRANRLAFADDSAATTCSARWKCWTRTASWNERRICSPSGPSSPMRRWTLWTPPAEALAVSISEKACVDMAYMAQLDRQDRRRTGRGTARRDLPVYRALREPDGTPHYVTADEYLLRQCAAEAAPGTAGRAAAILRFAVNVEALTAAQPKDLDAI